ncbi:bifunctional DNA-formamidopyrimidine glycosylase/DNA-(apurinic or apyrimidinic site) lyase [Alkalilimnicola ehrlichii MLHE-1]|uniref:Formamidopyrimidine-DNA glycosylase n=1 Tax=Alkalilimnicola ehrlichii (strain ATCC BAA-1101 / DSM 17681 / MLHE-1) TaxID=187272 RepID=FPG_ALKEH|nr:bifunctional DNA-formamidopyrimidine glycosylase/DNA-(apurinic or apyrimidinic site) lyase [Alkalilimnicola ehrlichii]Q0A598.1 RecName: Full=Formamidopyrimidine-DNA glycosylase; Short=Fapy-DNA glycosylase; AltName: Full=DNA-(apurinic or apyrimidinic site) lyase MutM; Short=AP lyase MutM [Alkalilimnicola ehrlichii MLHE-1]ABI57989.1 Formamidopyrimidine-DNA glycosylase / DNA-(apurinic or apyrimidinic site) lyase [Alkalilimnicola ehrlichii MLHE-1]
MPELPEVETTRRGLAPLLEGRRVTGMTVRQARLRWPVPAGLPDAITGQTIRAVDRRAKYLLFRTPAGTLILHLGMSGSLRVIPGQQAGACAVPPGRHDHVDLRLADGSCLRYTDPRRFGSLHWCTGEPEAHWLLHRLGPEPFDTAFDGDRLHRLSRGRRTSVKAFIMDSGIVVGVGNIYASESLFRAGIHPGRPAGRVGLARYRRLAGAVREVLAEAIAAGGTTLRDFTASDGRPGYFAQTLNVYGRAGAPCPRCGRSIRQRRIAQRSTWYCPGCQR